MRTKWVASSKGSDTREKKSDSDEKESDRGSSYQYVRRSNSIIPTASLAGTQVSVEEIRSAAAASDRYYPPSLHSALLSSPEPDPSELAIVHPGGYAGDYGGATGGFQRQILDEVETRELLIDHVGHRCCWGSRPARTGKIYKIEDCNVYVGTLDTFIEEREIIRETQAYLGGNVDRKDKGPELGIWELDLRSQFPVLFVPFKETKTNVPHPEAVEKCSDSAGRGDRVCLTCNLDQEPGFYKENQMTPCPSCHGRGLIAHRDGSDSICAKCNGKGKIPCVTCGSRGLVKCETCKGSGSLLSRNVAAYQCTPAYFADSYFLNKFSSEVITERAPVPPTARMICERHEISVVPVTRVTMTHRNRMFSFYVIGNSREVYLKDYYPSRFCWGLCPCLEWLKP
ncbi:hypothetical protein MLD38_020460 [Melastoma candidum]|uniref:Uncharacterized protein n=1 Tax=Melastoma candidum TaxID=119954 RepID=A0ACB9QDH3_9MYRT|nr:hypothetical protein MLD38_020460 [Melastoma candidum]